MSSSLLLDALVTDEVGIETGIHDNFRLKTAYQPIYAPAGDELKVAAFDAITIFHREGRAVDADVFLALAKPADPDYLAALTRTLHMRNHRHVPVADCELFLDHDVSSNRHLLDTLREAEADAEAMGEAGSLKPDRLICRVAGAGSIAEQDAVQAVGELRAAGFRLSFDLFDSVFEGGDLGSRLQPDVAEINGAWLSKIAGESAAARLLRPLAAAHRRQGTRLFIRGISSVEQFRLAVDSGADYLSGDFLGRALLAGMVMDEKPKSIAALLGRAGNVTPLRA